MKKIVALVLSLVMVLGLATTAFAATTSYEGLYAKKTEDGVKVAGVTAYAVDEVAVKYTEKGKLDKYGDMAAVGLAGGTAVDGAYVQVATLADADVVVYLDEDCKIVKFYLATVANTNFYDGVVFTNFGKACGQVDLGTAFDKDATYYTIKGEDTNLYVSAKNGTMNLKVGASYVKVNYVGEIETYDVDHKVVVESKNAKLDKVYCSACNAVAAEAANYMSLPENPDTEGLTGLQGYWYWTGAKAPAAGATVESAKTFDAGIAMYVGMSVMAAAGSAVVLKKKD